MVGADLSAWRQWDSEFWDHFDIAYQAAGSYVGGNSSETQASIDATRDLADWVNRNPPSVSNMHQYEVILRLARTWRDWVAELWAANNSGSYGSYKDHLAKFQTLYDRYNSLWATMVQQVKIMDLCPPAQPEAHPYL